MSKPSDAYIKQAIENGNSSILFMGWEKTKGRDCVEAYRAGVEAGAGVVMRELIKDKVFVPVTKDKVITYYPK